MISIPLANLFAMGGTLFMSLITLAALAAVAAAVLALTADTPAVAATRRRALGQIGVLALVLGILGQSLGLYQAMGVIEAMGGAISPALLAGGIKVSFIASIYGMIVCAISLAVAAGLGLMARADATKP